MPQTAFIVMAMNPSFPELDDTVSSIKRTCAGFDVDAYRVDDFEHTGEIPAVIRKAISESDFVVADLTHERPNVYYEIGFAHGVGTPVILLAKSGTNSHFDLSTRNTTFFSSYGELEAGLSPRISAQLNSSRGPRTEVETVCTDCAHLVNIAKDGVNEDLWYNNLCGARRLEQAVDPFDGRTKFVSRNDLGQRIFRSADKGFAFCRDVNDGACDFFEPTGGEEVIDLRVQNRDAGLGRPGGTPPHSS